MTVFSSPLCMAYTYRPPPCLKSYQSAIAGTIQLRTFKACNKRVFKATTGFRPHSRYSRNDVFIHGVALHVPDGIHPMQNSLHDWGCHVEHLQGRIIHDLQFSYGTNHSCPHLRQSVHVPVRNKSSHCIIIYTRSAQR